MGSVCKIAVTGALGQIAYSLLFRIASGQMLGPNQKVALSLLDIPGAEKGLEGLVMELQDGCFPLLDSVSFSDDPMKAFEGVDIALLVGAKPRGPGMERGDLLEANGKIFVSQGKALGAVAAKEVKVVVVGNPCNTNALICLHQSGLNPSQFSCLMMLDQNRAQFQLAHRAGKEVAAISNVTIWGNHSATQVPDSEHALIEGTPVSSVLHDQAWLEGEFIETVQKRGAEVIRARGKSSAASAANAIIDHVKAFMYETETGYWFSSGVFSKGNPYGIDEGLIFSFPIISKGKGQWNFVDHLTLSSALKERIKLSEAELIKERDSVKQWLR